MKMSATYNLAPPLRSIVFTSSTLPFSKFTDASTACGRASFESAWPVSGSVRGLRDGARLRQRKEDPTAFAARRFPPLCPAQALRPAKPVPQATNDSAQSTAGTSRSSPLALVPPLSGTVGGGAPECTAVRSAPPAAPRVRRTQSSARTPPASWTPPGGPARTHPRTRETQLTQEKLTRRKPQNTALRRVGRAGSFKADGPRRVRPTWSTTADSSIASSCASSCVCGRRNRSKRQISKQAATPLSPARKHVAPSKTAKRRPQDGRADGLIGGMGTHAAAQAGAWQRRQRGRVPRTCTIICCCCCCWAACSLPAVVAAAASCVKCETKRAQQQLSRDATQRGLRAPPPASAHSILHLLRPFAPSHGLARHHAHSSQARPAHLRLACRAQPPPVGPEAPLEAGAPEEVEPRRRSLEALAQGEDLRSISSSIGGRRGHVCSIRCSETCVR